MNKNKILVISNDAGATEYLAYLILEEYEKANWNIFALKDSPASKIFSKLDIKFSLIDTVDEINNRILVNKPDMIIYGTGWQINFSELIKKLCDKYKIKSIAMIDHWVNYKQRFYPDSLPENIIVMDEVANDIALKTFDQDKVNIILTKNYFLEYIQKSFKKIKNKTFNSVVFISEPTESIALKDTGMKKGFGYTEYDVVNDLIKYFKNDDLIIRLHPADDENKYDDILSDQSNKNIQIIKPYDEDLITTLSKSKLTIGFDGMALYISYILGINTISYMPNSSRKLHIPIDKQYLIEDLQNLDKINFKERDTYTYTKDVESFESIINRF